MSTTKKYRITHNSEIMITQICQLKKKCQINITWLYTSMDNNINQGVKGYI